jgi:hypothetical protein
VTRSISKDGPAELGEPFYSRQQLGHFNQRYVDRLRDAIASGRERAIEGVDRRPGTKRPRPFDPVMAVLP